VKALSGKKCAPCEGGVKPLKPAKVKLLGRQLHKDWKIAKDSKSIQRSLKFKDFYRTMRGESKIGTEEEEKRH